MRAATVAAFAPFSSPIVDADTLTQAWAIDDILSLDPAEILEFTASEIAGNTSEGLIGYDQMDVSKIYGKVAESWVVAPDGLSITFKIKPGRTFASGNPITAEDVAFSLTGAVKLDKSPAFILTQFGLNAENVEGSVLTETVFAWPGLGQYLTNSLQNGDMHTVPGGTLVIGGIFVGLNLLSDLLFSTVAPRVRRQA